MIKKEKTMKKNLVSLGIGAFLARLPVYSLPLFFVGIIPNIFSVSDELWSNIEFYVSQLLFLLLSLIIILVFMLIGAKEKREKKALSFLFNLGHNLCRRCKPHTRHNQRNAYSHNAKT